MGSLLSGRFVLAWLLSFSSGLAFFLFVHFPRYLEDLGASTTEIGVVVASTALAAIAIRPALGRVMDRRGRRPVILAGSAVHLLALVLYPTIDSIGPWLYTVRVLHGLGEALTFASIFTYAADLVPEGRRAQGLALFGVSGMLPIAVGGILGDALLSRGDFDAVFTAAIILGAVALLLAIPLRESAAPAPDSTRISFTASLTQRDLLPLWWVTLVFSFALTAYFTFLRTFVDTTGVGSVGTFFGAYAGTAITLRLVAGWVPDRLGLTRVLYPSMILFAAGLVVISSARSGGAIAFAGVLCGAGHGYGFPILYALSFGRALEGSRGSASAIFTGLFDMGALVGAPVLGAIVAWLDYPAMFRIAAVWVLGGLTWFALWERSLARRTTRLSLT